MRDKPEIAQIRSDAREIADLLHSYDLLRQVLAEGHTPSLDVLMHVCTTSAIKVGATAGCNEVRTEIYEKLQAYMGMLLLSIEERLTCGGLLTQEPEGSPAPFGLRLV